MPPSAARSHPNPPGAIGRLILEIGRRVGASRYANQILRAGRIGRLVATGFTTERITLRAGSLTYLTLLAIVPTLAVVYAMFKAFGGMEKVQDDLNDWMFANIAGGSGEVQEALAPYLTKFATMAHTGAVGGIGFAVLLTSAVSLLWNIEASFNAIWGVRQERRIMYRFLIYWCVLTLGPVFMAISLSATAALQGATLVQAIPGGKFMLSLAPLFITYTGFMLLYLVVPNARVKKRSAAIGAFVAGSVWELAKLGFAVYAARAFKANAFYGSLAAIPIFLLWTYLSWLVVLAGARVVYAIDASAEAEIDLPVLSPRDREEWSARVALSITEAFVAGKKPRTVGEIAHDVAAQPALVSDVLKGLENAGLIREIQDGGYVPARPPDQITLREVRQAALNGSKERHSPPGAPALLELIQEAEESADTLLGAHSLASLVSVEKVKRAGS